MGILFIGGLLLLNVAIAWWNCYVTGRSWDVVKHHGTAFERILLWCGAIQAGSGIGDALGGVGQAFSGLKGRDSKGVLFAVLIMIVIVALLAGALITATLIQRYRRAAAIDMAATA